MFTITLFIFTQSELVMVSAFKRIKSNVKNAK